MLFRARKRNKWSKHIQEREYPKHTSSYGRMLTRPSIRSLGRLSQVITACATSCTG